MADEEKPVWVYGTVIRSTGSWYFVRLPDGRIMNCRLKGKFRIKGLRATNPVAVGDHVTILTDPKEPDEGSITEIEQRHNYICLLYTSPSPRDRQKSRMPSSA